MYLTLQANIPLQGMDSVEYLLVIKQIHFLLQRMHRATLSRTLVIGR